MVSGRKSATGWRQIAPPRCANLRAMKPTFAGAAATSNSRTPPKKHGSKLALPKATLCPIGPRLMAAQACLRRRPRSGARNAPASAHGHLCRALASGCWALRCSSSAPKSRRCITWVKSRAVKSVGVRAIPNPVPVPIWSACRPLAKIGATIGWSTARKSGRLMPTRPTGFSALFAQTRRTPIRASASCCSI